MSGEYSSIKVESQGSVVTICLNRPKLLNAFTREMCEELKSVLCGVAVDDNVRVVVLTGAGGAFSSGADLKDGIGETRRVEDLINHDHRPNLEIIASMEKPVISAISGPAAGVGMAYALTCDLMVMEESSFLYSPFATISLVPDGGATWLLTEAIGYKRAYQIFIESSRMKAEQCLELGLANKVVPDGQLLESVLAWGEKLSQGAPLSLGNIKRIMRAQPRLSFSDAIGFEAHLQNICIHSADYKEGVAAFFEKRRPEFSGK